MATQKITMEFEVESPNGLNDSEMALVKEAIERTIYEYDGFTGIILQDEYKLPDVFVYCATKNENNNENTTEETQETETV